MNRLNKLLLPACVSLALTACVTEQTTHSNAPELNRAQKFWISSAKINQMAAEEYEKMLAQAKAKNALNNDKVMVDRVQGIAKKLIAQAPVYRSDALNWPWQVAVITKDEINAWCMPNGKIGVNTALLNKLQLTDDELAQVLSHEISHALREHTREQVSREQGTDLFIGVVDIIAQSQGVNGVGKAASLGATLGFSLPFSRQHETEADLLGIELAARAGYNPDAAANLWRKMLQKAGSSPPEFMSTHPSPESRLETLRLAAAKVQPIYRQALLKK